MKKFFDIVTTPRGVSVPGCNVLVRVANASPGTGALAIIYSDNGITPIVGSQVTTNTNGELFFYAPDGRYDLTFTGTGITTATVGDVEIFDATEKASGDTAATFTTLTAKKFADIQFADQHSGATTALKVADAGASLAGAQGLILVPSSLASGDISGSVIDNCTVLDYRGTGNLNNGGIYTTAYKKGITFYNRWTATQTPPESFGMLYLRSESAAGGINNGGVKANYTQLDSQHISRTVGQSFVGGFTNYNFGQGDAFGGFAQVNYSGGNTQGIGDEGKIGFSSRATQNTSVFTATVASVNGNVVTYSGETNELHLGEGRYLINKTTGVYSTGTAAATGTTITGTGTSWSVANLPGIGTTGNWVFSLDAEEISGIKYAMPVASRSSDTSLVMQDTWNANATTTTGAYKLYKASRVTSVDLAANTITVVDGTRFTVGDSLELPLSNLAQITGLSVVVDSKIASSANRYGLSVGNLHDDLGNERVKLASGLSIGGPLIDAITVGSVNTRPTRGLNFTTGPSPSTWFNFNDNVNNSLHTIFALAKNSGTWSVTYAKNGDELKFIGQTTVAIAPTATNAFEFMVTNSGIPRWYAGSNGIVTNNSTDCLGYSGNQSGEKWRIAGATGALTTSGALITKRTDVAVVNGANADVSLTGAGGFVKLTGPTGAFSISGFTGGVDGRELKVYNSTTQAMTITNDATSTAGNRIITKTAADVVLAARQSSATFLYDSSQSRWILMNYDG